MMNIEKILLSMIVVTLIAFIAANHFIIAKYEPTFKKLETQRIVISNKLASAKIVYENLNHVRDLVEKNMTFPGQKDSISHETIFFDFLTTCVNDLKMNLISCKPGIPTTAGRISTYGYDVELEGDFFSFGELCAKFENSRRITAVSSFEVTQIATFGSAPSGEPVVSEGNKGVAIKMHVNTFRIQKG